MQAHATEGGVARSLAMVAQNPTFFTGTLADGYSGRDLLPAEPEQRVIMGEAASS